MPFKPLSPPNMKPHLLAAFLALATTLAVGATTHVSVDTQGLVGNPAGPFYVDFQFNDGTGANDNQVNLANFSFGGGAAVGTATTFGGVTGDLGSGITLTDS